MQTKIKILFISAFVLGSIIGWCLPSVAHAQPRCNLTDWAHDMASKEVNYAVRISKCDESFVWQIMQASSFNFKAEGGFCHLIPEIVSDRRVWTDWRRQMRFCYSLYQDSLTHNK